MTSIVRTNNMKSFPVLTCNAYEGALTRVTTGFTRDGGQEDVATYAAPIAKGDLVYMKGHTTAGSIQVQKAVAANESGDEAGNIAFGIAVSDPQGVDNSTTSSGTPTVAYQRKVDVAFFGIGIIELVSDVTASPGDRVGMDESANNRVDVITVAASVDETDNGGMFALSYATQGLPLAILVGGSVHHDVG